MANQTIPNLPAAISVSGAEQFWAIQNGVDVRVTAAQLGYFNQGPIDFNNLMLQWIASLPTTLPSSPGVPWNDGGMLAIS